jgi:phosphatidate phosphatase LPIN
MFTALSSLFDLNKSVLSGAMDVIVVRQKDGSLKSTPFYARFGSFKIIKSKEKIVSIKVNGIETDVKMKLSSSGDAYFLESENNRLSLINNLSQEDNKSTDVPNSVSEKKNYTSELNVIKEELEHDIVTNRVDFEKKKNQMIVENDNLDNTLKNKEKIAETSKITEINKEDAYEEDDSTESIKRCNSLPMIKSRLAYKEFEDQELGLLDTQIFEKSTNKDSLNFINNNKASPLKKVQSNICQSTINKLNQEESLNQVNSIEATEDETECTNIQEVEEVNPISEKIEEYSMVTKESNTIINSISNPLKNSDKRFSNVDFKSKGLKYYQNGIVKKIKEEQKLRSEQILDLCEEVELSLCLEEVHKNPIKCKEVFKKFLVNKADFNKNLQSITANPNLAIRLCNKIYTYKAGMYLLTMRIIFNSDPDEQIMKDLMTVTPGGIFSFARSKKVLPVIDMDQQEVRRVTKLEANNINDIRININLSGNRRASISKRTLSPSSSILEQLNLNPGKNTIQYYCYSRLTGLKVLESEIYLWEYHDKVVISDVDGTITRSDVLGQLMPMFGKDWTHSGVTELFQNIYNNNYKILYLTARALCQANSTKSYLSSINQSKSLYLFIFV